MSSNNPTSFMSEEYNELKKQGLDWVHRKLEGPSDVRCIVDGKEVLMLCSNNYLGLANHPKLIEATITALALRPPRP